MAECAMTGAERQRKHRAKRCAIREDPKARERRRRYETVKGLRQTLTLLALSQSSVLELTDDMIIPKLILP
jgi:hypothetical protein